MHFLKKVLHVKFKSTHLKGGTISDYFDILALFMLINFKNISNELN